MFSDLPIFEDGMFTEFYEMGLERGRYQAWLHEKFCTRPSCSCITSLQEAIALIPRADTPKMFLVRVGYVCGFTSRLLNSFASPEGT